MSQECHECSDYVDQRYPLIHGVIHDPDRNRTAVSRPRNSFSLCDNHFDPLKKLLADYHDEVMGCVGFAILMRNGLMASNPHIGGRVQIGTGKYDSSIQYVSLDNVKRVIPITYRDIVRSPGWHMFDPNIPIDEKGIQKIQSAQWVDGFLNLNFPSLRN
tara:strand:- start:468 stop:944 length:477 start_codon:yes stop_codon:yes gene_type:complete